ncbi:MAG: 4Fe-4S single cluster domain-containing protein [Cycloclasticus sp.]
MINLNLYISKFIPFTQVEGPGNRACIQVQGCSIHCAGCAVPHTWNKKHGSIIKINDLITKILSTPNIEGVTFLGGEPFDQAKQLAVIGREVKKKGLSVMTFTGYNLSEIIELNDPDHKDLLSVTDLLIDGPFLETKKDFSRPWVGSTNQRFHFLTPHYVHLREELHSIKNKIEVRLNLDGCISINGLIPIEEIKALVNCNIIAKSDHT